MKSAANKRAGVRRRRTIDGIDMMHVYHFASLTHSREEPAYSCIGNKEGRANKIGDAFLPSTALLGRKHTYI
ncbi:MAG: hypothetical protein ACK55I_47050, partial [bacterium]